jgi:dihydropyrimidinase
MAMQKAAENGAMIMMHAENGIVIDVLREQALARGETDPIYHSVTRPGVTEGEATHRAIAYAELAGCPLYVVHMSAKEALDEIKVARDRGLNVFAETCPQYLFLGWNNLREPDFEGAKYVCSTPVRNWDEGHQEALWEGLKTNDLQVISTDHCPFCMGDHPTLGTQKRLGEGDFTKIPNGLPGVEERMQMIYHGAIGEGRLSLNRYVEVTATTPAKMFGLYPKKGTIAVGSDADIIVLDPDARWTMAVEHIHMDVDYTCYEGTDVHGKIETVLSKGKVLMHPTTTTERSYPGKWRAGDEPHHTLDQRRAGHCDRGTNRRRLQPGDGTADRRSRLCHRGRRRSCGADREACVRDLG